ADHTTESSGSLFGLDGYGPNPLELTSDIPKHAPYHPRSMDWIVSEAYTGPEGRLHEEGKEHYNGSHMHENASSPEPVFWDFKINFLGERDAIPVHFCHQCGFPIRIYGRMIPCQHVYCYDCASLYGERGNRKCPDCDIPVQQIEHYTRESFQA
uniref:RING-type domain-containing protein n=1 Tax=Crocodylus porosus TaxID=8502 RepID=A0A7M4FVF3_CROPO